jgi:hypothetical protein
LVVQTGVLDPVLLHYSRVSLKGTLRHFNRGLLPSYPVIGQNPFLLGTATASTPVITRPVVPGAFYSPLINPSNNENFSSGPTRPSPPPSNVGVSRIFFHGIEKGEKKVSHEIFWEIPSQLLGFVLLGMAAK